MFAHFKESVFLMKIWDSTRNNFIGKELILCKETFLSRTENADSGLKLKQDFIQVSRYRDRMNRGGFSFLKRGRGVNSLGKGWGGGVDGYTKTKELYKVYPTYITPLHCHWGQGESAQKTKNFRLL